MSRDVRAPADPQDFETTLSRGAVPPREFSVKREGDVLVLEVLEATATPGRAANTAYRIVYVPRALAPLGVLEPGKLGGMAALGETVAVLPALNDGGRQRTSVAGRSSDRGWYLCAPLGRTGGYVAPAGACRTPWG